MCKTIDSSNIHSWTGVALDTSVIIDYIKDPTKEKNPNIQRRIMNIHKIFSELEKNGQVMYYVTAVTLAELIKLSGTGGLRFQIEDLLSTSNITHLSYSSEVGEFQAKHIRKAIAKADYQSLLKAASQDPSKVHFARRYLLDDIKIISTIKYAKEDLKLKIDMVLTSDKNTFEVIAGRMGVPCLCVTHSLKVLEQGQLF